MKLSPQWLRDFVEIKADNARLAEDLTLAGIAVEKLDGSGAATVFEMDITTNRPDAMNHYGAAREASAIYDLPLRPLAPKLPAARPAPPFSIAIEAPDLCPRFTARVVRGVSVRPSPAAIAERVALLDQRPINNIVDASNYVLWEMGKPTHAFDLDLLEGKKIIVRKGRAGETLKTLDGQVRQINEEDLVIADASKPVGLAGVMGGFDTMITEKTRNILIESAWFDPVVVRRMSRRHGLHTDASHRFERGADYESTVVSCDRVAELVLASGGGELEGNPVDVIARAIPSPVVTLHLAEVVRHLGKFLPREEVQRILERLGFAVDSPDAANEEGIFTVRVPSWRLDVTREIDVIEEIARQHGYNKFANTLPAFSGAVVDLPDAAKDARLRMSLLALGYNEALSLTFISPESARQFSTAEPLLLANPLSDEASAMRTSLLPGMIDMLGWNLNRGTASVRLFEAGHIFEKTATARDEKKRISLGATGNANAANVHEKPRPFSFFDLKGDLETLFSTFAGTVTYDTQTPAYFHPGRSARAFVHGAVIAEFGQIHPELAATRKLRQEVFATELYLDVLYQQPLRQPTYAAPPKFPAVDRDFSFVFADATRFDQIRAAVAALNLPDLRAFAPAETFRGGNVPAGKYSLLLRAVFQSAERTLREEEVAEWSAKIISALETLGGTQRA
jgi:phenylalanyl-tRNA synthetase beta chain